MTRACGGAFPEMKLYQVRNLEKVQTASHLILSGTLLRYAWVESSGFVAIRR